jgi:glucokinase
MTEMQAVLGVDLGGSWVRAGKVRAGRVEHNVSRRISGKETSEYVLGEVFDAIDQVVDGEVSGIGFCVPSVVDVDEGVVYSVENIPSWREVRLRDELERRYGVPAFINNDANAFAVGELHFGKGRGHRNLVGLTIGTGLGAGVVIEGRLYSGTNCGAGEVGNIPYRDATLEDYCSGRLFVRENGVPGEVLYGRACAGDRRAQELIASLGYALGDALLIILYAYDPEIVVFGGSVSRAFAMFEGSMRERLKAYAFPHALDRVEIVCSEIEDVALLGAAAIFLDASLLNKTI